MDYITSIHGKISSSQCFTALNANEVLIFIIEGLFGVIFIDEAWSQTFFILVLIIEWISRNGLFGDEIN